MEQLVPHGGMLSCSNNFEFKNWSSKDQIKLLYGFRDTYKLTFIITQILFNLTTNS